MTSPPGVGSIDTRRLEEHWQRTISSGHEPEHTIAARQGGTERYSASRRLPSGFRIESELGRGGFGVVSLATQAVFERTVALKRMLAATAGETEVAAFYAEAVVTARLEHPNIVPVHDLVITPEGQLQLVMKRVEGVSWRELLQSAPHGKHQCVSGMSVDDHLDILAKVCDAVSFAHERGILHRDLKPENVMVGSFGEVQLMDWGCAVAFGSAANPAAIPRAEVIDAVAGTPAYMAPEMALGDGARIGPHSDVYLLGAMLYELLTGARPHAGKNVYAVLHAAAVGAVKPPQERAPDRDIPGELAAIAMAALERDPKDRIASVGEFALRLKDYRSHSQASKLSAIAAASLAKAKEGGHGADEHFRRAVSAAENAVDAWPEWVAGKNRLLQAVLAHAQHCLDTGAEIQAAALGRRAAELAAETGAAGPAKTAAAMVKRGDAAVATQAARHRQIARLRLTLNAAAAVIGIGLVVGLGLLVLQKRAVDRALAQAEEASAEAQRTLADLREEQRQRLVEQKRFAPGLVAQARAAIVGHRLDEAFESARGAASFDPTLVEARMLVANLTTSRHEFAQALPAAREWLKLAPDGADARELEKQLSSRRALDDAVADVALGDLFMRQHLPVLAESFAKTPQQRLEIYKARVEQAWPGSSPGLAIDENGKVLFDRNRGGGMCLKGRKDVVDLTPLRGMPLRSLDISETAVVDVSPLAGMPLEYLYITGTAIRSLAPLVGTPLFQLSIDGGKVDPRTLAGLRLTTLNGNNAQLTDLQALRGMPLAALWLQGDDISDLGPLADSPLKILALSGGVSDFSPLAHTRLDTLQLYGKHKAISVDGLPVETMRTLYLSDAKLADPRQLSRLRLAHLSLLGCEIAAVPPLDPTLIESFELNRADRTDLSALAKVPLKSVSVSYCTNIDLSPVAHEPLQELWMVGADAKTWASVASMRKVASLKSVIVKQMTRVPIAEFWPHYDAGEYPPK
jgi:hypothetical protein